MSPLGPSRTPGDRVGNPQHRLAALRRFEAVGDVNQAQDLGQGLSIATLLDVVDVVEHEPVKTPGDEEAHQPLDRFGSLVNRPAMPGDDVDAARCTG